MALVGSGVQYGHLDPVAAIPGRPHVRGADLGCAAIEGRAHPAVQPHARCVGCLRTLSVGGDQRLPEPAEVGVADAQRVCVDAAEPAHGRVLGQTRQFVQRRGRHPVGLLHDLREGVGVCRVVLLREERCYVEEAAVQTPGRHQLIGVGRQEVTRPSCSRVRKSSPFLPGPGVTDAAWRPSGPRVSVTRSPVISLTVAAPPDAGGAAAVPRVLPHSRAGAARRRRPVRDQLMWPPAGATVSSGAAFPLDRRKCVPGRNVPMAEGVSRESRDAVGTCRKSDSPGPTLC